MRGRLAALTVTGILLAIGASLWVTIQPSSSASSQSPQREEFIRVEPMPSSAYTSGDAFWAEMQRRVDQWGRDMKVSTMTTDNLVIGMDAIRDWLVSTENQWPKTRELADRHSLLCLQLPAEHPDKSYCQ
jgi:hypothetical protein